MTYDCFMLFNELDLLEIRLNILNEHVDKFVIGESTQTFSGKEKSLNFKANLSRFSNWKDKIIYVEIEPTDHESAFERAHFQKESLLGALNSMSLNDDDVVYFGDLDEIWKPQEVDDKVYKLRQLNYSYYLNNRSSEQWIGTIVGEYKNIKEKGFNWNRANPSHYKDDGGWHFTNVGGLEQVLMKIEAYDHQEFNNEEVKTNLKARIENGEDYVGRNFDWQGSPFFFHIDESELPMYILSTKDKWKKLFR